MLLTIAQLGLDIDLAPRGDNAAAELLPNAGNGPQIAGGGVHHGLRRTEMLEQAFAQPRTDAGRQRQQQLRGTAVDFRLRSGHDC